MQRITITIDAALAEEIDRLSETRGYQNRSEAVRDLVRAGIARTRQPEGPPRTAWRASSMCTSRGGANCRSGS